MLKETKKVGRNRLKRFEDKEGEDEVKTGQINPDCIDCPFAIVVDGENVEFPVMFCLVMFDFPVKHKKVKVLRQNIIYDRIEIKTCRDGCFEEIIRIAGSEGGRRHERS